MQIIELTQEQEKTISKSFGSEYLKDDLELARKFDEYDFDSLEDE